MTQVPEDHNHYYYEYFWVETGVPCYVGEGSGNRARSRHSGQNRLYSLYRNGDVDVRIVHDGLTKGEGETLETYYINKYLSEDIKLFNKRNGNSSTIIVVDDGKKSTIDIVKEVLKSVMYNRSIVQEATPPSIVTEIIDNIINSPNFTANDKKWLNPISRFGEFYKPLCDKIGFENVKNNMTMIGERGDHIVFFGDSDSSVGAQMYEVMCINEDFDKWETNERYDVILMNPPFREHGEKFIMKCAGLLKDGGYLGVVMLPSWRSIVNERNQHKKTYNALRESGGFHMIHMYSAKDTTDLFKQSIGQVDTFVWQKGVKINNTKIINPRGDEYFVDLSKYPQAPPVLPSRLYDRYFDQIDGIKWYMFSGMRNESYGEAELVFTDFTNGKEFKCNQVNVDKCQGKKVVIDYNFKTYKVDNVGNEVVSQGRIFFFTTDDQRDSIVRTLQWITDNEYKNLFITYVGGILNTYIPGIRV